MNFEIGEMPKGWKRGDKLRVIRVSESRPRSRGAVMHIGLPYWISGETPPEIGAVMFTLEMAEKVQRWLDWWYDEDPQGKS